MDIEARIALSDVPVDRLVWLNRTKGDKSSDDKTDEAAADFDDVPEERVVQLEERHQLEQAFADMLSGKNAKGVIVFD